MTRKDGAWYVRTSTFEAGGRDIAGPFTTGADAVNAREGIERLSSNYDYWIDQYSDKGLTIAQEAEVLAQALAERDDLRRQLQRIRIAHEPLHEAIHPPVITGRNGG